MALIEMTRPPLDLCVITSSIVQTLLGYIDPATNDNFDASAMWIVRKKLPKEEERCREKEETERKVCLFSSILEADDDLELLEKVKQYRKKRIEKRQRISARCIYKLSKVGQAIENNDLPSVGSVLGQTTGSRRLSSSREVCSVASKEKMLNHEGLASWFSELCIADPSFVSEDRLVWISIEGLPFNTIKKRYIEGDKRSFLSKEDLTGKISKTVFVTNFPDHITARNLWNVCTAYGKVVDVYIPYNRIMLIADPSFVSEDRLVWISIEGLPFNTWNNNAYAKIISQWGTLSEVDTTLDSSSSA
ncbi:RNA-directed DNA polymerase, eukaryota [Tanacetum coccineum]